MGQTCQNNQREKGFTLIEVLVAIAILLVALVAFVPLLSFTAEGSWANRVRLTATNLANERMEEIRSLPFQDVGVVGGNPEGSCLSSENTTIEGVSYQIKTYINWMEEESGSNASWDYKRVRIRVIATGAFIGGSTVEEMETLVARSSTQPAITGANIRIWAFRGWKENQEDPDVPVEDVEITITGPSPSTISQWAATTGVGSALFLDCEEGRYAVDGTPPLAMMVLPHSVPFPLTATRGMTVEGQVFVEDPCRLAVTLRNRMTGEVILQEGTLILEAPIFSSPLSRPFTTGEIPDTVLGNLWPLGAGYPGIYSLRTRDVVGYHNYNAEFAADKPKKPDGTDWDGTFPTPGTELAVTVYLIPVPPTPPGEDAIGLDWLNGNSHTIVQDLMAVAETEGQLQNVIFISGNQQETVKLSSGSSDFTALSVFFERNLAIFPQTHLTLRSKLLVFNGFVELQTHNNPAKNGRLTLFAGEEGIDGGSFSGGIPGEKYGRVDFVQGLFLGDRMLAEGAYYFPDGISLPDEYGRLVPVSI